jgi:hypothetical protein
MQAWERLGGPIVANGPRDPLRQFLARAVHPLCLAFCQLRDRHRHRNLRISLSLIAHCRIAQSFARIIVPSNAPECL